MSYEIRSVNCASITKTQGKVPNGVMDKPGFKVMHVQDIDYRSNCQPFIACLQEVRAWSRAHPQGSNKGGITTALMAGKFVRDPLSVASGCYGRVTST